MKFPKVMVILLLIGTFSGFGTPVSARPSASQGDTLKDFSLKSIDGKAFRLSETYGNKKGLILTVGASW